MSDWSQLNTTFSHIDNGDTFEKWELSHRIVTIGTESSMLGCISKFFSRLRVCMCMCVCMCKLAWWLKVMVTLSFVVFVWLIRPRIRQKRWSVCVCVWGGVHVFKRMIHIHICICKYIWRCRLYDVYISMSMSMHKVKYSLQTVLHCPAVFLCLKLEFYSSICVVLWVSVWVNLCVWYTFVSVVYEIFIVKS